MGWFSRRLQDYPGIHWDMVDIQEMGPVDTGKSVNAWRRGAIFPGEDRMGQF